MAHSLYKLLATLDRERIHYTLGRYRPDSVMVSFTLVGRRVEVDVFEDGQIEYSQFVGDESVSSDAATLNQLIAKENVA